MTRHLFVVTGAASPDLPLRVLNLFAQQDLAFERVEIARGGECYTISIEHHGLPADKANIIAEKLGAMVLAESVSMRVLPGASGQ